LTVFFLFMLTVTSFVNASRNPFHRVAEYLVVATVWTYRVVQ